MYSKQIGEELNSFHQHWLKCKKIIFFGMGNNASKYIYELTEEIDIIAIIDNDKEKIGKTYHGIEIMGIESIKNELRNVKIVVSTHYAEISKSLQELGLKENRDFCELNKFIAMWYWYYKHQVCLSEVHMAITTNCTLKCRHCNMYMPYYKKGENQPIQTLKEDIDEFFKFVDKIYVFDLLGGEPLLYPWLNELIEYVGFKYRDRIVNFEITTNGTIMPSKILLDIIQKFNITINISDYSKDIIYHNDLNKLKSIFESLKIKINISHSSQWLDFNFPHSPLNLPQEILEDHMKGCSPVFKGLNDKKFYYCHLVWSAVKCGLLEEKNTDYVDLTQLQVNNNLDKLKLLEYSLGYMSSGYVSLCKYCGGCGLKNKQFVKPAMQMSNC